MDEMLKILEKMQNYVDAKNEVIDKTYGNIAEQANSGNKKARTILNYGNEDKIKDMINVALNR